MKGERELWLEKRVEELEREKADGEFVCINAARAEAEVARLTEIKEYAERSHEELRAKLTQARIEADLQCQAGFEHLRRAEKAEAKLAEAESLLDSLKTEAGKAAFALANGWPLPEEVAALEAQLAEAERRCPYWVDPTEVYRRKFEAAQAEVERLTEMVDRLKKDRDVFRAALRGGGE